MVNSGVTSMPIFGQGRQQGGGCGMRVILAAVILISGVVTYFWRTQSNPVTKEKQRVSLTVDQEIKLGVASAPEMAAQMGGLVDRADPASQLVSSLGQKLAAAVPENPYQFEFHLLRDPETVNAFALPGGQIFITRGLLRRLSSEAQLAGVLGHEIGHVVHRHAAEHMATSDLYNSFVTATGVASGEQGAAALAQYVAQIRQLKYGRDDELESDTWGLKLMTQVGYDPREMLHVMKVLQEAGGGKSGSEMMSTHPLPASRVERIEAWIKETYPNGVPRELSPGRGLQFTPAVEGTPQRW
jgi:predicted Zn-dependent protease